MAFINCKTVWASFIFVWPFVKMKKKEKIIIVVSIIIMIISICACGISLIFYNPLYAKIMVDFYSDDSNFYSYSACIKQIDTTPGSKGWISIESVQPLDGGPKSTAKYEVARVFSLDIDETWNKFSPVEGLYFEFIGTLRIFFDGCPVAIVQISIDNEIVLPYSEGKEALLNWAANIH